ncbi:WW domain protein, partial [Ancylostoma duodenale]
FMPPPFFPPGFPMPGGRQPMVPTNPDEAWNEYTAPDGRKYYYNSITQENTWDKPQVLIDKECELALLENLLWIHHHLLLKRLLQ